MFSLPQHWNCLLEIQNDICYWSMWPYCTMEKGETIFSFLMRNEGIKKFSSEPYNIIPFCMRVVMEQQELQTSYKNLGFIAYTWQENAITTLTSLDKKKQSMIMYTRKAVYNQHRRYLWTEWMGKGVLWSPREALARTWFLSPLLEPSDSLIYFTVLRGMSVL